MKTITFHVPEYQKEWLQSKEIGMTEILRRLIDREIEAEREDFLRNSKKLTVAV